MDIHAVSDLLFVIFFCAVGVYTILIIVSTCVGSSPLRKKLDNKAVPASFVALIAVGALFVSVEFARTFSTPVTDAAPQTQLGAGQ